MPRRTTSDPLATRIGERIRELRTERKMSLADLAEASQVSKGHLSGVEHGLAMITSATMDAIARGLGVPTLYLFTFPEAHPVAAIVEILRKMPERQVKQLARDLRKTPKNDPKPAAARR